jgi:mono/diheme cytochrome c family protein
MRKALALLCAFAAASCEDQSMTRQPKYVANAPSPIFSNGSAAQMPPQGAVSQEEAALNQALSDQPSVDMALLERGRERFEIYCTPCHGFGGDGDGAVTRRGFPNPPSFHEALLMQAQAQHFVDVITNGHGVMYSYAARVAPHDRWAIAAYIRALQQSRIATLAEAPEAATKLNQGAAH